ncbi:LysM peptidoglycan-binding domain-containing protein [Shewanella salipaludis]|uniref:LysM peptidoglycan-binding domain-containing protein n=1 Tax=Shewanella salipaludis TaxID=2723052 RepID=A0A972G3E5_9GAMM|nr:LysM domain-containing protein [Shewanella salipaludis]NMH66766.1 LysM peptidoglycan-binding domain-containing protein [Shewanella salipaludis]
MDTTMKRLIFLALLTFSSSFLLADTLTLKPGHPTSYVVKKGDTLWDIAAHFLQDPWRWPKLWGANPQIANPHLIYPGDQLTLEFVDGEPRLVRKPHMRKGPEGRIVSKDAAIPAIDLALIQPYLVNNRVVDAEWLAQQPMVLGGESPSRHHIGGDVIYINAELPVGQEYGIYAQGREFFDKASGDPLGQEVILTASSRVIASGPVSKIQLLSNLRETKAGYRVLAIEDEALTSAYFTPQAAALESQAHVLASEKNIREMGKLDIAYLDKGSDDGVLPGQVFSILREGDEIVFDKDGTPISSSERSTYDNLVAGLSFDNGIKVPDVHQGKLMVFKVFDKTSMGLILVADHTVRVDDKLVTPESLALRGD